MIITAPWLGEQLLDLLEPLFGDLQPLAVGEQPAAALAPAELVGREVAEQAADPDDRDQHEQRDLALPGDQPADDHGGLAGGDEAEERAGLQERQQADGQVGPRPERLADVLQHVLEVRQLDDADADQDRGGDRHQLGDLDPALLLVAAGDQPARQRRGGREPGELHAAGARVARGVQPRDRFGVVADAEDRGARAGHHRVLYPDGAQRVERRVDRWAQLGARPARGR